MNQFLIRRSFFANFALTWVEIGAARQLDTFGKIKMLEALDQ